MSADYRNVRRVAVASAAFAAPTVALALGEQLAWGAWADWWPINTPAGWGTGRVVEDAALSLAAVGAGIIAYRKTSAAIAKHDAAQTGLTKRTATGLGQ